MRFPLAALLAAALVAPVSFASPASAAAGELEVVQLNVGQGDSSLFRAPCGEVGMIDAGTGSADDVADQLSAWGVSVMDWAAVTHYHDDHMGDVRDLAASIPVVYDAGGGATAYDTQAYADYYTWAQSLGAGHVGADVGDILTLCSGDDLVTFTVVSAGQDGSAVGGLPVEDENDQGLCFHVEFGDFDMATCGDLNGTDDGDRTDVESAVADQIGDVEVVKVNHHGASYSSSQTYVTTLAAEAALISVGSNSYGHPSQTTVTRWQGSGATVYLTGLSAAGLPASGDITVSTDGVSGFAVQTERSDDVQTSELDENPGTEPAPEPAPAGPLPPGTASPRGIEDSCPEGHFPEDGFVDVPAGNVHETAIDCLVWWRVANGRDSAHYAPAAGVARDAMASFIARAIGADLSTPVPDAFTDDNQSVHQQAINYLAHAGIVGGTGGGQYSPSRIVTRGQMARFMANAAAWRTGAELPATRDYFDDDASHLFETDINQVAEAGVTGGRGARAYEPSGTVSRDQMASFLARLLDLFVDSQQRQRPAAETTPRNPGDDVDCDDFGSQAEAQAYYDHYRPHYGDVARLDADNDGTACEIDAPPPPPAPQPAPAPAPKPYYANCSEARAAGAAPLYRGEPGYRSGLDRDNDGVACE